MKIINSISSYIESKTGQYSNKKKVLVFSLLALFLLALLLVFIGKPKENNIEETQQTDKQVLEELKPVEFTQEQLTEYYKTYEDPYVKHVRVALNGYLDGSMKGIDVVEAVVTARTSPNGTLVGLDAYSKDYYKSKFIVIMASPSVAGGKEINIIFQDKPDKIFWTWVYAKEGGEYDLRGFSENKGIQGEKLQNMLILYKNVIGDKEHSL